MRLCAKAALVHSVDSSEKAIDLTRKNIELNGFSAMEHLVLQRMFFSS